MNYRTATMMTFGEWVKNTRETRGWTITRCAERANMKWQAWQRLENDEPRRRDGSSPQPRRETVEKIAAALDVPMSEALQAAGYATTAVPPVTSVEDDIAEMERRFGARLAKSEDVEEIKDELSSIKRMLTRILEEKEKE